MDDNFRIGARTKAVSKRLELRAKFAEIVDFSIVNNRDGFVFVPDGLAATGQIHDAQPAHAGGNGRGEQDAFFIWAAMDHGGHHAADDGFAGLARLNSDNAANSAH